MKPSVSKQFSAMFAGDESVPWPNWPAGFSKPWWPPLSEVWINQGRCPNPGLAAGDHPESWAAAWAALQRLHAEFLAAKEARQ